jgi:hypothetical protein
MDTAEDALLLVGLRKFLDDTAVARNTLLNIVELMPPVHPEESTPLELWDDTLRNMRREVTDLITHLK